MKLSDLLDRVNLPDVITQQWGPDAVRGLTRERGGVICDRRPGQEETHPSFSVYKHGSNWRWKRHGGDGASGNTYGFLLECGYTAAQAREELARHAGINLEAWEPASRRPTYAAPDPLREARAVLERCAPLDESKLRRLAGLIDHLSVTDPAARDLQRRGLYSWKGLQVGRLRHDFHTREGRLLAHAGALGLLSRGPDGKLWGLKVRNLGSKEALESSGLLRYVYRIAGHGAPAWCSPRYGQGAALLIVEGELNGAAAALASEVAGLGLDVQGLAGAGSTPFLDGMSGKPVYLYADGDAAGTACLERLGKLAHAAGAVEVRVLASLPTGDFCDHLSKLGALAFGSILQRNLEQADLWQSLICGKTPLPQINNVLEREKDLWVCGNFLSDHANSGFAAWENGAGGWSNEDRGGW